MTLTEAKSILGKAIANLDVDPNISMWEALDKLETVGVKNLRSDVYTAYCIMYDELAAQNGFNGGY